MMNLDLLPFYPDRGVLPAVQRQIQCIALLVQGVDPVEQRSARYPVGIEPRQPVGCEGIILGHQ
ncbi:hypothetical protein D3C81_2189810 [compost metagenome]